MDEVLFDALHVFLMHFKYFPEHPDDLEFDQKEYADLLLKCVKDNFDYTIEMYGTDPTYGTEPWDGIYID